MPARTSLTQKALGKKKKKKPKAPKLSRLVKPAEMSLEQWQIELRKQFGRTQTFRFKNLGEHPVFSEFLVSNPESRNSYRVRIRGRSLGDNSCMCPDFATNTLGTCKHIEFALAKLERGRETAPLLRQGFRPSYSEICLEYGGAAQSPLSTGRRMLGPLGAAGTKLLRRRRRVEA